MKYLVIKAHRSEYPKPLNLKKGDRCIIGEKYVGPEGWDGWYFCTTPGHSGGWVAQQVIERLEGDAGQALEDFTSFEMDVDAGDTLTGTRTLNGWAWCKHLTRGGEGWVPLENLQIIQD